MILVIGGAIGHAHLYGVCFPQRNHIMGNSDTLLYFIAGFVLLHILVGMGYLIYKISGTAPKPSDEETTT